MANKHAVVRTDLMYGTDVRTGLVSVDYMGADGSTATEIDNGHVVKLAGLKDGEREVYVGKDVEASDKIDEIVLLAAPEVDPDERKKNLEDYTNPAGKHIRGYRLHTGDIFSLTKEAFAGDADPKKDDVVELAAGTQLKATTGSASGTAVGKVIAVEFDGTRTYYVVRVD